MIPKVIHYCWFGGKPLPELARRCLASWQKFLPDYSIKQWNEQNYDVTQVPFVKDAYEAGNYSYVSDYVRFDVLYREGGIYFDTDVEVVAPIDDIMARGPWVGKEQDGGDGEPLIVASGLGMAAEPGMEVMKQLCDRLQQHAFRLPDGTMNRVTVVHLLTQALTARGLQPGTEVQQVGGFNVYPREYFCPWDYIYGELRRTPNTRTIHWYTGYWLKPEPQWLKVLKRTGRRLLRACRLRH